MPYKPEERSVRSRFARIWASAIFVFNDVFRTGPIHWRLLFMNACLSLFPYRSAKSVRTGIYRLAGFDIDLSTIIYGKLRLWGSKDIYSNLHIGRACRINTPCSINLEAPVSLGNYVVIGHDVTIITTSHSMDNPNCRAGAMYVKPVVIEDGAWIGANATILPGVIVGKGAVVGAGSVVTGDVPAHTLIAGNPARSIRSLNHYR